MTAALPEVVSANELTKFIRAVLEAVGLPAENATLAADVVVEGDLRGVDSHGTNMLNVWLGDLKAGRISPTAQPEEIKRFGAMAWYDGKQGYAPAQIPTVLPDLLERAEAFGIAATFLRDTSHWGCPAYYSRWMARRGFYGIAVTNTNPGMPLWGSSARSVGNNPLTIAAPRRDAEPIVLDMAMQQIAWGALKIAQQEGRTLPGPWGFDEEGAETNDPAVINRSGRVRPVGDHKGSGLAFMLEILTGIMSGGLVNFEVGEKSKSSEPAHYCNAFIAIKPDLLSGTESYFDKVATLYETSKKAPLAAGFDQIRLPGDQSNETLAKRSRDGIPTKRIRAALDGLSQATNVPLPA